MQQKNRKINAQQYGLEKKKLGKRYWPMNRNRGKGEISASISIYSQKKACGLNGGSEGCRVEEQKRKGRKQDNCIKKGNYSTGDQP